MSNCISCWDGKIKKSILWKDYCRFCLRDRLQLEYKNLKKAPLSEYYSRIKFINDNYY